MRSEWYIALAPDGEAFDPVLHKRRDIDVDGIDMVDSEAAGRRMFAVTTDIGDPCHETLKTRTWAHVAREKADGTLQLMGTGYVDPVATQAQDEDTVSIEIYCSPRDWAVHQSAALAPLKVLPGFDPVLVPAEMRDNAVEILDGYSRVVHCHPVTHEFTVIDIFGTGLPLVTIADPDHPGPQADAMSRPVKGVEVSVRAEWIESRDGEFDVTDVVNGEFVEEMPNTVTPDAFESAWFQPGANINGDSGYTVRKSKLVAYKPEDLPELEHKAGPVRGSSDVYNYVTDADLDDPLPQDIMLDRVYYDCELSIGWKVRQKRVEIARFTILNGAPTAAGGAMEKLDLTCEDVTLDEVTPPWEPDTAYAAGAVRRVGTRNWLCTEGHVSGEVFAADVFYVAGGMALSRWEQQSTDQSPLGSRSRITYFHQTRGLSTIQAAALKARAIIAASIRNRPCRFETQLTDELLTLTTGYRVKVRSPDQASGWLEGKVTEMEIVSTPHDEYLAITVSPAGGTATAVVGADPLSQTGEAWDRIVFGDYVGQQPEPFPAIGGRIAASNTVDEQLEYVGEHDFSPADGREDPVANDPVKLLEAVPTSIRLSLTQISGRDAMENEIVIPVTAPWSGPKQYGD